MKGLRLFLIIVFLCILGFAAEAQSKSLADLTKRYSKTEGVSVKSVGKMMIATARALSNEVPAGLKSVNAVSVEDRAKMQTGKAAALDAEIARMITDEGCRLISESEKNGHKIKLYAASVGSNGKLKDVMLYVTGSKSIMVMELVGEFDKNEKFITDMTNIK